jgi:hypothetical protein
MIQKTKNIFFLNYRNEIIKENDGPRGCNNFRVGIRDGWRRNKRESIYR